MRDADYREKYYLAEIFRMPASQVEHEIGPEELYGWRIHMKGRNG